MNKEEEKEIKRKKKVMIQKGKKIAKEELQREPSSHRHNIGV